MEEQQDEKKYSKIQWFFVCFVIPTLFAVTVALVIATVSGVNVFEKAKEYSGKIPFLSSGEQVTKQQSTKEIDSKLTTLKATVKDREAAIADLQTKLDSKDQEIQKLELEKEKLQKQIDDLTVMQEENRQKFKEIVKTYESMSAKKAAPIITRMNEAEALKILSSLKAPTLAAIMEKMTADDAAKYTALLANNTAKSNQ